MFKLDQKEFIEYRLNFLKRLAQTAEEIVADAMDSADLLDCDTYDILDACRERIYEEAENACIYTADCYQIVQFFNQWDTCEIDDAEQSIEDRGGYFGVKTLDDMHIQLAYALWENQLTAAVENHIGHQTNEEAA